MRVVIIEDEELTAQRLARQLHQYDPALEVLATLASVAQAVAWLRAHPAPDLLFLDIHLDNELGFRIFEQLALTTPVIFTTAYNEYLLQAFQVNSLDYLLKPVRYEKLAAALDKYHRLHPPALAAAPPNLAALLHQLAHPTELAYRERFMVSIGLQLRSVEVADIAYFFLEERAVWLTTHQNTTLPLDYSLDKLTHLLNPRQFFRVNRQYVVNLAAVLAIHAYSAGRYKLDLRPAPRHAVIVSGERVVAFKEWLGK